MQIHLWLFSFSVSFSSSATASRVILIDNNLKKIKERKEESRERDRKREVKRKSKELRVSQWSLGERKEAKEGLNKAKPVKALYYGGMGNTSITVEIRANRSCLMGERTHRWESLQPQINPERTWTWFTTSVPLTGFFPMRSKILQEGRILCK